MATSAYHNWVANGRPWKLAEPIKAIGDRLRRYGYTVYYLGDNAHLQSSNPQDHTPFSRTGWPVPHPYPWVLAMDIMPPPKGSGLPSLQRLGAQLVADKQAGIPGIACLKYVNWEPERDWGGPCYQDSFKPNYRRTNSNDRGHIHFSGRSDMVTTAGAAATYDPVARIRGTAPQGDDVTPDQDHKLTNLYNALFAGGTSMGNPVPGKVNPNSTGNALVDLVQHIRSKVDNATTVDPAQVATALAGNTTFVNTLAAAIAAQVNLGAGATPEQVEEIVDRQLDQAFRGGADNDTPTAG